MAVRSSGLSLTDLRCDTAPHTTDSLSPILSSGSTSFCHIGSTVLSSSSSSHSYNFPIQINHNSSIQIQKLHVHTINTYKFFEQLANPRANVLGLDGSERREIEIFQQRIVLIIFDRGCHSRDSWWRNDRTVGIGLWRSLVDDLWKELQWVRRMQLQGNIKQGRWRGWNFEKCLGAKMEMQTPDKKLWDEVRWGFLESCN